MLQDNKLKAFDLIDQVIMYNKGIINDFDTIQGFFDSIKNALCDGEYLATLNTSEEEVNSAFELLEQFEDHKDLLLDVVLKDFLSN